MAFATLGGPTTFVDRALPAISAAELNKLNRIGENLTCLFADLTSGSAATYSGALAFATDSGGVYLSDGSTWRLVAGFGPWTGLPYNSNWADSATLPSGQYRVGVGQMQFRGQSKPLAGYGYGAATAVVATLPTAARPTRNLVLNLPYWDSGNSVYCILRANFNTDGTFALVATQAGGANSGSGAAGAQLTLDGVQVSL